MKDDAELLRSFARDNDERAFAELVDRRLPMVYQAALRQVQQPQLAEEVAQAVFVILARKAKSLRPEVVLSGWLYQTTRYASQKAKRTEVRRIKREREAREAGIQMTSEESQWKAMTPLLDQMMGRLREQDRLVLVLRFLENRSLAQIGDTLGTSEDAAQKRVARALERLRRLFAKHSIHTTSSALSALMLAQAGGVLPASLAAGTVSSLALGSATVPPLTATIINTTLNMMTWIKIKTLVPVGAAVAVAAGVPMAGLYQKNTALEEEKTRLESALADAAGDTALQSELDALRSEVSDLTAYKQQAAEVHKLRAQVAQMKSERAALNRELEGLRAKAAAVGTLKPASAPEFEVPPGKEHQVAVMNSLKRFALALVIYADQNDGQFPESLEGVDVSHLGNALETVAFDDLVMIDYGTFKAMDDPASSVVIATKDPVAVGDDGRSLWAYAFGDGHSEVSPYEVGEDGQLLKP